MVDRRPSCRRGVAGLLQALALGLVLAAPVWAQGTPARQFLIINQERLLTGSQSGQTILEAEESERDRLRTEARALDASFEAEEQRLTEQRAILPAEEFRTLADAFDARVVKARRDQDTRATELAQDFEARRRQFYTRVAPILVRLMDNYRALAILDETSVLVADQSLNITADVIAEIDAQVGGELSTGPEDAGPEPVAPETVAPEADVPGTDVPETGVPEPSGDLLPDVLMPRPPVAAEPGLVFPPRRSGLLSRGGGEATQGED